MEASAICQFEGAINQTIANKVQDITGSSDAATQGLCRTLHGISALIVGFIASRAVHLVFLIPWLIQHHITQPVCDVWLAAHSTYLTLVLGVAPTTYTVTVGLVTLVWLGISKWRRQAKETQSSKAQVIPSAIPPVTPAVKS